MVKRQARRWVTTTALAAGALVLAGCGARGDGGPADVERATPTKASSNATVVATLGDSIVAGSPLWDPDPSVRAGFQAPTEESQWQHWVDDDDLKLRNCGVWGERTDEIAERFGACAKGAEAIVIQGGINDIVQGRSVGDALDDLACMADRAVAMDLPIALVQVLPWNNGDGDAADSIRELNDGIDALGAKAGVPVLPFHDTLDDPKQPGRMPENLTSDGNHPNVAGYRILGEQAWLMPKLATGAFGCA